MKFLKIQEIEENVLSTEDVLSTDKERVSTDMEKVNTDRPIVSTDGSKVSTDGQNEGTEENLEGTEEQIVGTEEKVESTDGHKKAKAVSREKEKGVELKDIEETDRPRPTSKRSLLTLNPLPKIDPKDKGKKKIEDEDESNGIPEAEKKFKQLESDEEMARKIQEEWEAEEERNRIAEEKAINEALIRNFDDIKARIEADRLLTEKLQEQERESEAIRNRPPTKNQLRKQMMTYLKHVGNFKHAELKIKKFEEVQALYEKIKRSDEYFISIGSTEDERLIKRMNEKGVDSSKSEVIKEERKEEVQEESKEEVKEES
ncbi:hypothetical protein Tco_0022855, partial [Tanacetum coccineum]